MVFGVSIETILMLWIFSCLSPGLTPFGCPRQICLLLFWQVFTKWPGLAESKNCYAWAADTQCLVMANHCTLVPCSASMSALYMSCRLCHIPCYASHLHAYFDMYDMRHSKYVSFTSAFLATYCVIRSFIFCHIFNYNEQSVMYINM